MNKQLLNRRSALHIRHVLEQFNDGLFPTEEAMLELGVSRSTLFALRKEWLSATRAGNTEWMPGTSGGNHHPPWPDEAVRFLREALSGKPPFSYAFAASEVERLLGFRADRAQVRKWAIRNGLAHHNPRQRENRHWRRFHRTSVGELMQLDATPHAWFGHGSPQLPMLNMLDDCSRMQVGGVVYANETLDAYIHFLKKVFETFGLPLQVFVDQAPVFKSPLEGGTTRLKNRLDFYGISFIYANSPQAKGKIERLHQVWQDRLPTFFAKNGVPSSLESGNEAISNLIAWRNGHERHRETGMTAQEAWQKAVDEGRNKLRERPKCPWWEYIWSLMTTVNVMPRGRVLIGSDSVPVNAKAGERVILCNHTDGTHSVIKEWPRKGTLPIVLFSDRPKDADTTSGQPTVRF